MGRFGGKSPKPHIVFSNDQVLVQRILDRAGYMSRLEMSMCPVRTTRTYTDKHGVKRCVGVKNVLRESQYLASCIIQRFWFFTIFLQAPNSGFHFICIPLIPCFPPTRKGNLFLSMKSPGITLKSLESLLLISSKNGWVFLGRKISFFFTEWTIFYIYKQWKGRK